jgi:hypothetical protein
VLAVLAVLAANHSAAVRASPQRPEHHEGIRRSGRIALSWVHPQRTGRMSLKVRTYDEELVDKSQCGCSPFLPYYSRDFRRAGHVMPAATGGGYPPP